MNASSIKKLVCGAAVLLGGTAVGHADGVRQYDLVTTYVGSGNPQTPLAVHDNRVNDVVIGCTKPSCVVLATIGDKFCNNRTGGVFIIKLFIDGMLVGGDWIFAGGNLPIGYGPLTCK